ncbi:hypothetical protein INR28_19250 [Klebsiella pneumoniae]|uniref:hypothetical protein n=1 Tax=Klebsiella pneumoniae TaxID=573 RepID=UPI001E5F85C5|nr:hypothetical protein [Klebsiella pneumoniae]MCC7844108.1 hypothetical protein [Klebsiella pneumoniae]
MENGKLAQQQGFDLALQILKSQRGYYIGTATSEGYPVSRESAEYFPDSSTAQQALTDNRCLLVKPGACSGQRPRRANRPATGL